METSSGLDVLMPRMPRQRSYSFHHEYILRQIGAAMASGGTVMSRSDKMDNAREQLGIKGQGLATSKSVESSSLQVPSSETSPDSSRPESSVPSGEPGEAIGSFNMPPEAVGVLETVINMNKTLEQQIEALRLRLCVENKHYEIEKQKLLTERDTELNKKEEEIGELKDHIVSKEGKISGLTRESELKDRQLQEKVNEISNLKILVKQTEEYAEKLQKRVDKLKDDKHKLESDTVYKEQNEEIKKLKHELVTMKDKISTMEKELARAKNIIEQQSTKVKTLEFEKGAMHDKFKEELDKATRMMRSEVERMREVMKQQYEEMRNLREQNLEISSDVRDIKDLLLQTTVTPEIETRQPKDRLDVNNFKTPRPLTKSPNNGIRAPMTTRTPRPQGQGSVRTSMPAISYLRETSKMAGKTQNGLPPISRDESRWIPVGISKQTNVKSVNQTKRK